MTVKVDDDEQVEDVEEDETDEEPDEEPNADDESGDDDDKDEPADEPKPKPKAKSKSKGGDDIEALVEAKVKEALGPVSTKGQQPPTTGGPDGGLIEHMVDQVLKGKEHAEEHERLKTQTTQEPRKQRKGLAKLIWGE